MLQGDAEYFGLLLIKKQRSIKLLKWPQKKYFYFSVLPISMDQEWFHSFEIGCK